MQSSLPLALIATFRLILICSLLLLLAAPITAAPTTQPTPPPPPAPLAATSQPATSQPPRRGMRIARLFESPATAPSTLPSTATFDATLFSYPGAPTDFIWATPNTSQTLVFGRPPPAQPAAPFSKNINDLPKPFLTVGAEIRWLTFKSAEGDWVPALLVTPQGQPGPFPLVIATHGLLSQKMQVVSQVAPALIKRGFAVLAIDLPRHGERPGSGLEMLERDNPKKMFALWKSAVIDIRQAIDLALQLHIIDSQKPVTLLGYSLGSWISTIVGASDPRASAMILMVGGATNLSAELMAIPQFAASDPRIAIAAFSPRPVLLVNGRNDTTVTPAMADRLFQSAREPKEQRWYPMGHILKDPAFEDAADWLTRLLPKLPNPK